MNQNSHDPRHAPRWQWWLALVAGVLTVFCGSLGIWKYDHEYAPGVGHGFNPIYHALQMLILHTSHFEKGMNNWIEAGRWFGVLTFFTISAALLWKRLRHEFSLLRLAYWSRHHVVCGLGQKGLEIVRCLKKFDKETRKFDRTVRVVVIDQAPDEHFSDECAAMGVCVITGDATEAKVLARARVAHAKEVIAITPEDETNIRIAAEVRKSCSANSSEKMECYVHLSNIHLRERLQRLAGNGSDAKPVCVLNFFDVFDNEARRVLLELPLDGAGISKDDPCSVHVVILGFGRMGRSLALRAAKLGHFANHKPLRISVIDRHADQQREHFLFRYPVLEKQTVCQLNFHQGEAQSLSARKRIEGWAAEPDTRLHIFACLDDNARAVEVGLRLQEALVSYPNCTLQVRIKNRASLADILELSPKSGPRISTFGMVEDTCCDQAFRHEYNEAIARAIHEHFVRGREADSSRKPGSEQTLQTWEKLPEEIRESNRQQADHIAIKLRAIGYEIAEVLDGRAAVVQFSAADVELLAELEHTRWNTERWLAGWRYGPPGKRSERVNEYLVPWGELDDSIKKYDRDAITQIPERLSMAQPRLKVVRRNPDSNNKPLEMQKSPEERRVAIVKVPEQTKFRKVLGLSATAADVAIMNVPEQTKLLSDYITLMKRQFMNVLEGSAELAHEPTSEAPTSPVDKVHFLVSSPSVGQLGQQIIVDVWAHLEQQRAEVERRVQQAHHQTDAPSVIRPKGPFKIERGTSLFVRLKFQDFHVDPPEDVILWEGEIGNASFEVVIPTETAEGVKCGLVTVHWEGGLQIARVPIQILVAAKVAPAAPTTQPLHHIRKAFASYASADREEVLTSIQGMQKIAPELEVFYDEKNLRSGSQWQQELKRVIPENDVLYLFWSAAAKASPWVEMEWRYALNKCGIEFIDPVPLVSPEEVPPPKELGGKHFKDWVLAYRRRRPKAD